MVMLFYIQVTVDTLLSTPQSGVFKEWDPLPSLPECIGYEGKHFQHGGTSVVKESGLNGCKKKLSPHAVTRPTENKVYTNKHYYLA